ncbi:MAG TPA: hypothetical protein DEF45_12975 [Rhodopirellula sp.]|nr:hypothetical protein [Rhodopirellula sp.]
MHCLHTDAFSATDVPHLGQGLSVFGIRFGGGGTASIEPRMRITPVSVTSFAAEADGLNVNANTN